MIFLSFILVAFALLIQGVLSGLDSSLRTLDRLRLHHLANDGVPSAVKVERLLSEGLSPLRSVETLLIFSRTLCMIIFVGVSTNWQSFEVKITLFVVLVVCFLFFSEILPRSYFMLRPIDNLGHYDRLLRTVCRIARPYIRLFSKHWSYERVTIPSVDMPVVTRDTVHKLIRQGVSSGALSKRERDMISRALSLQRRTVRTIMTPRRKMVVAHRESTLEDCFKCSIESGYARIPLLSDNGSISEFVNVLSARSSTTALDRKALEFARELLSVQAEISVMELLQFFREKRQSISLVESKGVLIGLVTMDDILSAVINE